MLGSRRGRPSLVGRAAQTAARTAIITGTATAVAGRGAARHAPPAAQAAAAAPAPTGGGLTAEAMAQLKQLAELHHAGILTEQEFAEQKAKILNG